MNINDVVINQECMSCGACVSVCFKSAISLKYKSNEGLFIPKVDCSKCVDCGLCVRCCPALHQESNSLLGEHRGIYLAHSTDPGVRHFATSGGVINSLIRFLLNENYADTAVIVRESPNSTIGSEAELITKETASDLQKNPRKFASRYVVFPVLEVFSQKVKYGRILVVGTPCQINAARKLAKIKGLDCIFLGITCSGGMRYTATEEYKRLRKMETASMFYRGDGWPGKNSLILGENRVEEKHSGSMFERMFSSQVFKNPACKYCKDHFAEYADISFCDFWDADEIREEKVGNSCVILRNERAEQLFQKCLDMAYIEVTKKIDDADVLNTQIHVLKQKKCTDDEKKLFKTFYKAVDIIYKKKIYRLFSKKMYCRLCAWNSRICRKINIV